jgi:spermidine/putrescine transport system substrate-binding protein
MNKYKSALKGCLMLLIIAMVGVFFTTGSAVAKDVLNLLVMPGYEEPQIINEFEEKYNCKVNYKIYPSSDEMMALIKSAKRGTYDVLSPDAPYVEKLVKAE